jgi:hypothetical protein
MRLLCRHQPRLLLRRRLLVRRLEDLVDGGRIWCVCLTYAGVQKAFHGAGLKVTD